MNRSADNRHAVSTLLVIDGSGDKNRKAADRKRPIYRWDAGEDRVRRVTLGPGQTPLQAFSEIIQDSSRGGKIVIAADLPIGIPEHPSDVYQTLQKPSFPHWLEHIHDQCVGDPTADCPVHLDPWRERLIAPRADKRTPEKPFVSLGKGQTRGDWAGKRRCDHVAGGESLYCVDHGPKQVGKAALQFWFDVLIPLRSVFAGQTAIWPFEDITDAKIVFAECYPALCQRLVFGRKVSKRSGVAVAGALTELAGDATHRERAELSTWIYAASSEDEFDMFVTAIALSAILKRGDDLFDAPGDRVVRTIEGWMLSLTPQ